MHEVCFDLYMNKLRRCSSLFDEFVQLLEMGKYITSNALVNYIDKMEELWYKKGDKGVVAA